MADLISSGNEGSSLDAVVKLLGLITGSGKQTTTTSGGMSPEGLSAILKQSLDSNQGLAQLLGGQNAAGMYNSSTNQMLSNDLVSRLTAQAQANSISKTTTTQTQSPLKNVTPGMAGAGAGAVLLNNLMKAGGTTSNLNKASNSPLVQGALQKGKNLLLNGASDASASITGVAPVDVASIQNMANASSDPLGSLIDLSGNFGGSQAAADAVSSMDWNSFDAATAEYLNSSSAPDVASQASQAADTTGAVEEAGNFHSAVSATGSQASGTTSGADTASAASGIEGAIATTGAGLGTAADGISYAAAPASTASLDVGFDLGSGLGEVSTTAGMADAGGEAASAAGGSYLGYLGSALYAMNAPNNPKGEQNADYRQAAGSAVLNYLGYGWATPIVDAIARPVLNAAMEAGTQSLGTFGAVLADPVGAPLSGQYDVGELITSTLDPANIFGGNPGGSPEQLAGALVDPVGAALGSPDWSPAAVTTDILGSIGNALGIGGGGGGGGKVICTELHSQSLLSDSLYLSAISPKLIMKGRVLQGYHVIGVPFVHILRKSPWLSGKVTPYVADYIRHKAGDKNLRGAVVKLILHSVSWVLGFFNSNPEYYRTLYRRERKA